MVAVPPFEVNARPDLNYLRNNLPQLLRDRLGEMGVKSVSAPAQARQIGLAGRTGRAPAGATHVAVGSMTQLGESLSFDVRLTPVAGGPATNVTVVKEGVINVLPAMEEVAGKIRDAVAQPGPGAVGGVGTAPGAGGQIAGRIAAVEVQGLDALEQDVVLTRIKSQVGDEYDPKAVNEDIKRILASGYFDDAQARLDSFGGGQTLIFTVKEKPRIQGVGVSGNKEFDSDEILKIMTVRAGSVLNLKALSEDMNKIREMYKKKGFYLVDVSYKLQQNDPRTATLNLTINEGKQLFVKEIKIQGAKEISESELKGQLALSERGLISWITGSGVLNEELLDRDAAALESYYGNRGFMDAKVGKPLVDFKDDGIFVTFQVVEGQRYKVGKVEYAGDIIVPVEELKAISKMDDLADKKDFFDRSVLRDDMQRLSDFYTNYGYAFADADVKTNKNEKDRVVDVAYVLNKGRKVYIRRVVIEGNDKTRENVIRRQMRLSDGEQFSGVKLKRSNERLNKLDYFEKAEIEPTPTDNPNELDLKVKVKEKPTGQVSAGAGYSTLMGPFFTGSISERNLFGKGYELGFSGTVSGKATNYNLNFTNPNVYDSLLAMGLDAYVKHDEFFTYDKDTTGGRVRFGYPLGEYTRLLWGYRLDNYTIKNVDVSAPQSIKDIEGDRISSTVSASVTRDTTDRRINPSRGSTNTLSIDYAGGPIGGDDDYIRYTADTSWYFPIFWKFIFHWHAQIAYISENMTDGEIPDYEKFYLGGMNSVRGYGARRIAPRDENNERFGGDKQFFTNFELIFPLYSEMGIMGVTFFDAGNVWDKGEFYDPADLKKSVGAGIRWYSPLGPLRLEYGYALDEVPDNGGRHKVEFSVGQFF